MTRGLLIGRGVRGRFRIGVTVVMRRFWVVLVTTFVLTLIGLRRLIVGLLSRRCQLFGDLLLTLSFPKLVVYTGSSSPHVSIRGWFTSRKTAEGVLEAVRETMVVVMDEDIVWPLEASSQTGEFNIILCDRRSRRHDEIGNVGSSFSRYVGSSENIGELL